MTRLVRLLLPLLVLGISSLGLTLIDPPLGAPDGGGASKEALRPAQINGTLGPLLLSDTDLWLPLQNAGASPAKLNVSLANVTLLQPSVMYSFHLYGPDGLPIDVFGRGGAGWGRAMAGIRTSGERMDFGPPPDAVYSTFYEIPRMVNHTVDVPVGPSYLLVSLERLAAAATFRWQSGAEDDAISWGLPIVDPLILRLLDSSNEADWDHHDEVYTAWGGMFAGFDVEMLRNGNNYVSVIPGNFAQGTISITASDGSRCERGPVEPVAGYYYRLPPGPVRIEAQIVAPPWSPVQPVSVLTIITDIPLPVDDAGARVCFDDAVPSPLPRNHGSA